MKYNLVALLPMKGHSERVPGKNLKVIARKPLCLWVLETLLQVKEIDKIVINTDSAEIASTCSLSDRIIIHDRPSDLCGDLVSMNEIINYDIDKVDSKTYIQTHVTNPLLKSDSIIKAYEDYMQNISTIDSVFSVTTLHTRLYDKEGKPINHNPKELIRTQDLPPVYEENSNFFIFSKESFKKNNRRIGDKPKMFPMSHREAIDIDELIDFEIAEYLLKRVNQ